MAAQELLTLQEASERYGVPVPTLRLWRRLGILTRYQRGDGRAIVDAGEIRRRLEARARVERVDDAGDGVRND